MPSKFTENYNLSQWEKTDKVLMEDFNADNAAIDAALQAQRFGRLETIYSYTIPAGTTGPLSIDFDMTDIRPEDWYFWVAGCGAHFQADLYLRVNGIKDHSYSNVGIGTTSLSSNRHSNDGLGVVNTQIPSLFLIPTARITDGTLYVIGFNKQICVGVEGFSSSELHTISFTADRTSFKIMQDSHFFLLGMR